MDLQAFGQALSSLKLVFDLLRSARESFPQSPETDAAAKALADAERQLAIAEAEAAKSFGFPLCGCSWPPKIMVLQPGSGSVFACATCARTRDTSPPIVRTRRPAWLDR